MYSFLTTVCKSRKENIWFSMAIGDAIRRTRCWETTTQLGKPSTQFALHPLKSRRRNSCAAGLGYVYVVECVYLVQLGLTEPDHRMVYTTKTVSNTYRAELKARKKKRLFRSDGLARDYIITFYLYARTWDAYNNTTIVLFPLKFTPR